MPHQLLFIHGAMDTDNDPDGLVPFLKQELAGEFTISRPQLPEPDAEIWGDQIEQHLSQLAEDAVLVGHSFGGSMLLKVIAERCSGLRVAGMVLLAPPWWGPDGWDVEDFMPPENFTTSLAGLGAIVLLHGRADEVVSFAHQAIYAQHLPAARFMALEAVTHDFSGAGHAAVLDAIRSI